MSVKRVMPKGGRKPSKTLWAMVRGLADEEWRLISGIAVMYFKETLQFKLLSLLRSMEVYDHAIEKATFEGNDLRSMRKTAKRWLIRTASRLALYPNEVSEQVVDVGTLLAWGIHDDTIEFIAEAKAIAKEQEEFGWLAQLYRYELRAVKIIFEGDERTDRVAAVSRAAMENGRLVALEAEIEHQAAIYLEKGRSTLLTTGKFDVELAARYLQSKFHRQRIDEWPVSFQIQKLRIDEAIHYYLGDAIEAAKSAEKLLQLSERLGTIRKRNSEDHVKCLFRLVAYYTELENRQKVVGLLDVFRKCVEADAGLKPIYLLRLPATLLRTSFVLGLPELAVEGVELWKANSNIFATSPIDPVRFETMIYICSQYLSVGNIPAARDIFNRVTEVEKKFPYLTLQTVLKVLHLMLLLNEDDERGLQSFSKNYKRHLNACLKANPGSTVAQAGLQAVMILGRESNLEGKEKREMSLRKLLELLESYEQSSEVTLKPWSYAMKKWTVLQLQS